MYLISNDLARRNNRRRNVLAGFLSFRARKENEWKYITQSTASLFLQNRDFFHLYFFVERLSLPVIYFNFTEGDNSEDFNE